jgi:hypothetical protein
MSIHVYPWLEEGWGGVAYFGQTTFKEIIASYWNDVLSILLPQFD